MTRGELITRALEVLSNGETFRSKAVNWVNDALTDLENYGNWIFLRGTTTLTLTSGITSYLFSSSVWPAAALTNYSKNMKLFDSNGKPLKRFIDEESYGEMQALGMTAANPPTYFICFDNPGSVGEVKVLPTPTTTPGVLTCSYIKQPTLPTLDSTDLLTTCGIPPKIQLHIVNYLKYRLYDQVGQSENSIKELQLWEAAKKKLWAEENIGGGVSASAGGQQ